MTRPMIEPADEDLIGPLVEYTVPDRLKDDGAAVAAIKRKAEMDLRASTLRVGSIVQVRSYRARAVWPDDPDALEPTYEPISAATGDLGDTTVYVLRAVPREDTAPAGAAVEAAGEFALECAERDRTGWGPEQWAADAVAIVRDPRFTMAAITEDHVRAMGEALAAYAADYLDR